MPFVAWQRPSRIALELRAISRHVATLTDERTRLSNRLHAAEGSAATPGCVRRDLRRSMGGLNKRIARLPKEAVALVEQAAELKTKFQRLIGIPRIPHTTPPPLLPHLTA